MSPKVFTVTVKTKGDVSDTVLKRMISSSLEFDEAEGLRMIVKRAKDLDPVK